MSLVLNWLCKIILIEKDPTSYKEATNSKDAEFWKEAIDSELEPIRANET